ncbi:MAG TPA: NAD(P) transhydrogenase subunit alpha [Candidatus Binatia bacterium]|nr:NAD(P) transhydrogenase subunit alpha [Candidatus Binatia bacterium]
MIVGVAGESFPGERRVALVPEGVRRLVANKIEVAVTSGAGLAALFSDDDYARAGARLEPSREKLLAQADLVVKIRAPTPVETESLRRGALLVCLLYPCAHVDATLRLAARGVTALALENMPRTTVAQSMDVLSSQSTAAGYRAVIVAANLLAKFFPMLMTPAGTFAPARVLVLGAGVAGLQAIATARRLGALVEAFDVRRAVREQVESLGAKYIEPWLEQAAESAEGYAEQLTEASLERARNAIRLPLASSDVCITTALLPQQRAPILITREMFEGMRPGSVLVDLAAEQGGNCELTKPGEDWVCRGVTIVGRLNLAAEVAQDASRMFSRNMEKFLAHLLPNGLVRLDFNDEITGRCVVTHGGEVVGDALRQALAALKG